MGGSVLQKMQPLPGRGSEQLQHGRKRIGFNSGRTELKQGAIVRNPRVPCSGRRGTRVARTRAMPQISRFFGITISMFYTEHGVPHFHADYSGHQASVEIETGLIRGTLAPTAERLVLEWLALHRSELLENWHRARAQEPLHRIAPLD
jgi:hypothetical protein